MMAAKITQEIIDLYDSFTHGLKDRRTFMADLAKIVGGIGAANLMLPVLTNNYAHAAITSRDDHRLTTETVHFDVHSADVANSTSLAAYMARPAGAELLPAVIVIHENRGLNPHIEDVARRIALEGFQTYAVDMLSGDGGTPADEDKARDLIGALDKNVTTAQLTEIAQRLAAGNNGGRKVGAIGFCWGGGMVNALAVSSPDLDAAVSYYGRQPEAADVAKIKAAMLLHYGGEDNRINAGITDFIEALRNAGVAYDSYIYDGAQHAFNNDTNEARYNKPAADIAWARTIKFLNERLKSR